MSANYDTIRLQKGEMLRLVKSMRSSEHSLTTDFSPGPTHLDIKPSNEWAIRLICKWRGIEISDDLSEEIAQSAAKAEA